VIGSRAARFLAFAGAALAVAVACSCGPQHQPARQPAPAPSTSSAAPGGLPDIRWGRFPSKRFDLSVPLPDGPAWRIDDHRTNWLVATHPASSSTVRARMWREPGLMSRERCEARAREWTRDIPVLQEARILERRAASEVPAPGFDTELVTGVARADAATGTVEGFAMAFGASMKRCVALVFTTSASGPDASLRVGDRLGVGARILEGTTFQSELTPPGREPLTR
jgi:hypothetical protein